MRFGNFAGVTGAALIVVASVAGCGGSGDKAAAESSTNAAAAESSANAAKASAAGFLNTVPDFYTPAQAISALAAKGVNCVSSKSNTITSSVGSCQIDGSIMKDVTFYVSGTADDSSTRIKWLVLQQTLVEESDRAEALFTVSGYNWYAVCRAIQKSWEEPAKAACTAVAKALDDGGNVSTRKSKTW